MPVLKIRGEDCVSLAALCRVVGCSKGTGTELKAKGIFEADDDRWFSLSHNVPRYFRNKYTGQQTSESVQAKTTLDEERRRKLRIENDQREGKLVPFDRFQEICREHALIFRSGLEGIPGRIANDVAGSKPAEARAILLTEHRRVLNDCADRIEAGARAVGHRQHSEAAAGSDGGSVGGRKPSAAGRKRRARTVSKPKNAADGSARPGGK